MTQSEWIDAFLRSDIGDTCVEWPFSKDGRGYGQVCINYKMHRAHRVVLTRWVGPPPSKAHQAAHAPIVCHNRACVNPRHLRWATQSENSKDKTADGMQNKGEKVWSATMTNDQVLAIYAAQGTLAAVAARFGVSTATVSVIKRGNQWAGITGHDRTTNRPPRTGDASTSAVLTETQALEIYRSTERTRDLAARYGVSPASISAVRTGRTWAWLTGHNQENAA